MKQPILIAQELRKAFGDNEAVRGISFSVMRGEIFSLLGPNGAGKTTTINMLSCLIEPTGGTAEKPVGLVHLATARRGGALAQERHVYSGDRAAVRMAAVETALAMLRRSVEELR